jgi:hypothetical protein
MRWNTGNGSEVNWNSSGGGGEGDRFFSEERVKIRVKISLHVERKTAPHICFLMYWHISGKNAGYTKDLS